jgi:hypothetical protein
VLLLVPIQSEFEKLLGEFRQRKSPVCVIYGHTLALAENDPAGFKRQIVRTRSGWVVRLADGLQTVVLQSEAKLAEKNGYIAGGAENLLNIYCIAVSKRCGGFNFESGMLDYGKRDYAEFMGSGKWSLYDDGQGSGRTLSDGLDRLIREWSNRAKKRSASTIGFGDLSSSEVPEYIRNACKKYTLISGHDFSVSRYDPEDGRVLLRNPHNPRELIAIPLDLMRQLPAGIDFEER